jgi:hypothetical protein
MGFGRGAGAGRGIEGRVGQRAKTEAARAGLKSSTKRLFRRVMDSRLRPRNEAGEMAELETDRLRIREVLASDVDGFLRYM